MKNKNLLRKLFCLNFLKLGNVREASIKAGYPYNTAFNDGLELLFSDETQNSLERLSSKADFKSLQVRSGLERIAFGTANDAVNLIFCNEKPDEEKIAKLDLFNISEIKRDKDGGIQIKFFDRQSALEKLWEIENTADVNSSAESFFNALKGKSDTTLTEEYSVND